MVEILERKVAGFDPVSVRLCLCEVCAWLWLVGMSRVLPARCPNRACKSRKWNAGRVAGKVAQAESAAAALQVDRKEMPAGLKPSDAQRWIREHRGV